MAPRVRRSAEHSRIEEMSKEGVPWQRWGPYLSERSWGTPREDYSRSGDAWSYFPHDHARSRIYRWGEEGLAGVSDDQQFLCLALALWNGRDPMLKERIFGLSPTQANHGQDPKEYWWYLDATPTYSWMRWRYVYPQLAFPYVELVEKGSEQDQNDPSLELADTEVLQSAYWEITADYAKAGPDDLLLKLVISNVGRATASIDVLPTLWFRNTWAWGDDSRHPSLRIEGNTLVANHPELGRRVLTVSGSPEFLCCENDTNVKRIHGLPNSTPTPKDGINDYVVHGAPTVNREGKGTKAAAHYRLKLAAGSSSELRLRLAPTGAGVSDDFDEVMKQRAEEANAFFATVAPATIPVSEAQVIRQSLSGLLWSKQFYHYDVSQWLNGDPASQAPPIERKQGRNADWPLFKAKAVYSVPDKWEYPWHSSWEGCFSSAALARVSPQDAKRQLLQQLQEWHLNPDAQLAGSEENLSGISPPIQAWAALKIFEVEGRSDLEFLERVLHKLLANFTWWINQIDNGTAKFFSDSFLGLNVMNSIDSSQVEGPLKSSEGLSWLAMYCLNLLEMALILATSKPAYEDTASRFFDYFVRLAKLLEEQGIWDEDDNFYYDFLRLPGAPQIPLRFRSVTGLIPILAVTVVSAEVFKQLPNFAHKVESTLAEQFVGRNHLEHVSDRGPSGSILLSIVSPRRLRRVLKVVLDEKEFLSRYGVRSLSKAHLLHPFGFRFGDTTGRVDYQPGESQLEDSRGGSSEGNCNWRGPIWIPFNYLLIEALKRFNHHLGEDFLLEYPVRSGEQASLLKVHSDLADRVISIFMADQEGKRPVFGERLLFRRPAWRDQLLFYEYFHGETGCGLGASHQAVWGALVASMLIERAEYRAQTWEKSTPVKPIVAS